MSDDEAFLRAIHELPADHTRRLIYADYLEEQDNETANLKAEYLRLECELEILENELKQTQRTLFHRTMTRLAPARKQQLMRRLDEIFIRMRIVAFELVMASEYDWLIALDVGPVKHCLKFQFQCPKRWDQLEMSDATNIRFCPDCQKSVFYTSNYAEAADHALRGECVAINSASASGSLEWHMNEKTNPSYESIDMGMLVGPDRTDRIPLAMRGVPKE